MSAVDTSKIDNQWYFDLVDRCANDGKDIVISNGESAHARYLIMKLFDVSLRSVQMYCGALRQQHEDGTPVYEWDNLIQSAKAFLDRPETNLDILIEDDEFDGGAENAFIKGLKESPYFSEKVTLKKIDDIAMSNHVVISDGKAFRFETDDEEVKAIANFNDPKQASEFSKVFKSVFTDSLPIPV